MQQSKTQYVTSRVLIALTLAVASFVGFSGIAEAATCLTCHAQKGQTTDIRPVDAAYRNITTGGFKGSHVKHIPAATVDANACTPCHAGSAAYDTKHRNGFINVTSATAPGLSYTKGSKFPQSGAANLTLGSCSTASCHANVYGAGTVATPVWGAAAANCTACHTTPIGATGPATGSHTTTIAHAVACTTCHAAGTTATAMPSANHNNGTIDIENVGYPLAKAKGSTAASCSTASCHVNVYGVGSVTTPVWGTSASCNACHTVAIDATGPNTGSHAKHNDSTCTDCHAAGTTSITKPDTGHADGNVTVTNGYPVTAKHAAGSYAGTCSTAACHADPYSAGTVATPVWGTSAGCAACHTGANVITANGPATGSHTNVTAHAVACTTCHAAGTTSTSSPSTGHADGKINVVNVGYPQNKVKGTAGASCSTSVCHGSTSPVWGTTTTNDTCTKCHGTGTAAGTITAATEYVIAPSDPTATDTGKVSSLAKVGAHQTHLQLFNGLSQQGADAKARCEVCHTLPTVGTHANGSSAPVFTGIAAGGTYDAVARTCSVSCHNPAGSVLSAGNAGTATAPQWNNANYIADGTLKTDANCNTCHKSPGNAGFTASLSHDATAMPLGIGTDCSACHGHNGGTGGAVGQQHMDGIKFGNGSCDACHGYPPLTSAQFSARTGGAYASAKLEDYDGGAGHHATHLLATVKASDGFTPCLPCHPSGFHNQGNGTVAKANINVNDAADLTFRFDDSRAKRYTVATQSCSNVSCHYQPTPAWTFGL